MLMTKLSTAINYPFQVVQSSCVLFKNYSKLNKCITLVDFVMQVYSRFDIYLIYTGIRCTLLLLEYLMANDAHARAHVWEKAQVYANTKVLGLVLGQIALLALGSTTPIAASLILMWGMVLFSMAAFAHYQANKTLEETKPKIETSELNKMPR